MKFPLREHGFSLVQVLLLSGALAASAMVAIQTFRQQKNVIKEADNKDKVEQIHNMIYSILQNRNHCLKTLVNSPGSITIMPNTMRPLPNIEMVDALTPAFEVNANKAYLNNGVSIASMDLQFPADLKQNATLSIIYNRESNNRAEGTSTVRKTIKIALQRSAPDQLLSCTSITESDGTPDGEGNEDIDKEICEEFDLMTWNEELRSCVMKDNLCPPATIFEGLDEEGNKICGKITNYLQYLVNPSFTQTCPDDFDQIKLNRTFTVPHTVSIECNKKGDSCPSTHKTFWKTNPTECEGYLPRMRDGQTYTATDITVPTTGNATYECDKGNWRLLDPSKVCIAPCSGGNRAWRTGVNNCNGPSTTIQDGEFIDVDDNEAPTLGKSKWKCVTGSWQLQGGHSCKSPCLPGNKTWNVSGATCDGNFPEMDDGEEITLTDSTAPSTGVARFKCENGALNVLSGRTCTIPPEPGICKWSMEITWQNPDCTGFQTNQLETTTASKPVSSMFECTSWCGVCRGGKSYDGCAYTPL